MIQEERSIFWEVVLSVTVRTKRHVNTCLILNGNTGDCLTFHTNSYVFLFVSLDEQ